jgi:hypothetical protein
MFAQIWFVGQWSGEFLWTNTFFSIIFWDKKASKLRNCGKSTYLKTSDIACCGFEDAVPASAFCDALFDSVHWHARRRRARGMPTVVEQIVQKAIRPRSSSFWRSFVQKHHCFE